MMLSDIPLDKTIVEQVAKEFNLYPHVVELICKHQFKFVSEAMLHVKTKGYHEFYLRNYGRFKLKPRIIKFLDKPKEV